MTIGDGDVFANYLLQEGNEKSLIDQ